MNKTEKIVGEVRKEVRIAFPNNSLMQPYEAYNLGFEAALKAVEIQSKK